MSLDVCFELDHSFVCYRLRLCNLMIRIASKYNQFAPSQFQSTHLVYTLEPMLLTIQNIFEKLMNVL